MNDIFDVFNSLTKSDPVKLRRPITPSTSESFMVSANEWLKDLKTQNNNRKSHFIDGLMNNIKALLYIKTLLQKHGIKYLSTRHLCQDALENLFGQIRQIQKFPNPQNFKDIIAKLSVTSLIKCPATANCQVDGCELLLEATSFINTQKPFDLETFPEGDAAPSRVFSGNDLVGKVFETATSENAAAYFSGYLLKNYKNAHKVKIGIPFEDCEDCCKMSSCPDIYPRFVFNSFKEYTETVKGSWALNYCDEKLVDAVIAIERVFLYCFDKYKHVLQFGEKTTSFILKYCDFEFTCCDDLKNWFIKFFVKCRTFHTVRFINDKLAANINHKDKLKKLCHK